MYLDNDWIARVDYDKYEEKDNSDNENDDDNDDNMENNNKNKLRYCMNSQKTIQPSTAMKK